MIFSLFQKGQAQRFNFSFEQFTTEDGLSHENITNLVKDKDGFLWIGTTNGLNRFDGISFKNFYSKPDNAASLPANYISGVTIDKRGFLWIATSDGICRMDTRS